MSASDNQLVKALVEEDLSRQKIGCNPQIDPKKTLTMLAGAAFTEDAVNVTRRSGFCSEDEIPSNESYFFAVSSTVDTLFNRPSCDRNFHSGIYEKIRDLNSVFSPQVALRQLATTCKNKIWINKTAVSLYRRPKFPVPEEKNAIKRQTNALLDRGQIASLYFAPVERILKYGWLKRFQDVRDKCTLFDAIAFGGPHAMTVVGREYNSKRKTCEFKIRNSWGKDCSFYKKKYRCKDGYLWIEEKEYLELVHGLEWLE